jgi:monofunctional biosynthetic peptidoglycan transglycosylase
MGSRMETSSIFGSTSDRRDLPSKKGHPRGVEPGRIRGKHPFIAVLLLIASWSALVGVFVSSLPDVRPLKSLRYNMTLTVRDPRGRKVPFIVGPRNPYWTPLARIPAALQWGVIVAEDDTFYEHNGFNFAAMRDALWDDIKERRFVRGGSTITQQLAKNLYLSREKSLWRKLKEAIITCKLERHLSKKRILELYLNAIEWSPGVHGVGEASQHYFHKSPADLDFFESILLAAIIPSPRLYNPLRYPERALERYRTVVWLMYRSKLITFDQYKIASAIQFRVDPEQDTIIISPR